MSIDDKLTGLPDDARNRKAVDEEHARRLHALADGLSRLDEAFREDLARGDASVPATPPVKDALDRLLRQHDTLTATLDRIRGRYALQGADAYTWPADGRQFNYYPLTLDELAQANYPPEKLAEGVVEFRHAGRPYTAAYYTQGLIVDSGPQEEYGAFCDLLKTLRAHHGALFHDNLHGDDRGLSATLPVPMPDADGFVTDLRQLYADRFAITGIRAIYRGIARDEFERATLPADRIFSTH